jgi:exopolysaccharide production protein ExoY
MMALPLVLALLAVLYGWVKLVSPGSFIFRQIRMGRGGNPFIIFKIRTMKPGAPTSVHDAHVEHLIRTNQPMTKLDVTGDPRLIKGGLIMRMSGLDELPQLYNVLRGEMSLVGPRPCTSHEYPLYAPEHSLRFGLQPGLTGLWQVRRNESTTFREMAAMDVEYVNRLSPYLDISLIIKTPMAVMHQMAKYILFKCGARTRKQASCNESIT